MWQIGTLAIYLISSLFFTAVWIQERKPSFAGLGLALGVAIPVCIGLSIVWREGALPAALLAGQIGFWIHGLACRRPGILPGACVGLGSVVPWVPIGICDEQVGGYGLFLAALLLCLLMMLTDRMLHEKNSSSATEPYRTEVGKYSPWIVLPCLMLPVAIVLLMIAGALTRVSALVLCVLLFAILALFLILQEQIRKRQEAQILNEAFFRWQRESRDYMNTIRSQRHDFNLHLHAISGLVGSGDYDGCRDYVQKLVSDAAAVNDIMPVSDAVVGSMMYNMREEARRCGSDIIYHITYDMEDIFCNGFECNKIIGNLLQNAIDALHTPEDKAYGIRMRVFKRRGNTVITVENRFTGDRNQIARVFEPGYSTKKNHDGIGLPMVLRTVQQYGGRVYPEFEEDIIRFVVNIPNKVSLTGKGEEG